MAKSSVNTVLCNHAQSRNREQLIVGSNIDIQGAKTRQRITPQNSTLMPDMPGIIPLMYLIFAPTVQLFKGQVKGIKESQIIKLIAGLGNTLCFTVNRVTNIKY